jgi:hypothetical protein
MACGQKMEETTAFYEWIYWIQQDIDHNFFLEETEQQLQKVLDGKNQRSNKRGINIKSKVRENR